MIKKGLIIFLIIGIFLSSCNRNSYQERQDILAKELKININDYPWPSVFPIGYYYELLKPGMSIDEVHKIITNYDEVYACGKLSEIYYYFSKDDENALRFRVLYEKDTLNYFMIQGEDSNSRDINVENCVKGKTQENPN